MGRQVLVDSKLFYPKKAKTSEARLRHYATNFRLAEIDSAYYALSKLFGTLLGTSAAA